MITKKEIKDYLFRKYPEDEGDFSLVYNWKNDKRIVALYFDEDISLVIIDEFLSIDSSSNLFNGVVSTMDEFNKVFQANVIDRFKNDYNDFITY